ncbi:MAG: hypothetical protein HN509_00270 [Halobacteriovoraceae bacterium]|nr:hypothetical protein [Halobacteriovoraceae bacterium]MBT5095409.1 hypothetical protein [Halobacteriovoraceae bacterium]
MKKTTILLFLLFNFAINFSQAYDIQATIEPIKAGTQLTVAEGEPFEAEIKIWPFGNSILEEVAKIEGTVFLDYFYVAKIDKIEFSPNNQQVVVIRGVFVLTKKFGEMPFVIWSYKALNIPVTIKNIVTKGFKPKSKSFLFTDQAVSTPFKIPTLYYFIFFTLLLVLGLVMYFKKKRDLKNERIRALEETREGWLLKLKKAKKRKDYEKLYLEKSYWVQYLEIDEQGVEDFCKTLRQHMYKKKWHAEELDEVENSFTRIRGGIE